MADTIPRTSATHAERRPRDLAPFASRYTGIAEGLTAAFCQGILTPSSAPARHRDPNRPSSASLPARRVSKPEQLRTTAESTLPEQRHPRPAQSDRRPPSQVAASADPSAHAALSGYGDEPDAHAVPPSPFTAARADLLRDLRRIWMSAPFRRSPCAILAAAVRTTAPSLETDHAAATFGVIQSTLSEFGTIYDVGPLMLAAVLPNVSLHQAHKMADIIASTIDARSARRGRGVALAAGIAALHRDRDPSATIMTAEACLRLAFAGPQPCVVTEIDPGARAKSA